MRKPFSTFSRLEKILILLSGVVFFLGVFGTLWVFAHDHTTKTPAQGGVYREGVIAQADTLLLNPLYVFGKRESSVESDIVNLLFRGLIRFNSTTGELEDSMGDHSLTLDKRTYTFKLKEGLRWHDGEDLTADDVVFTFHDVIQNEDFSNQALKKAFSDVVITKINEREVSFTLPYPYKFFLTNFTVGLLPKHILKDVPVAGLEFNDFSSAPIGNGPFAFEELKEIRPNVFRMTLNAFRSSSLAHPKLDVFEFWIYPSKESLSLDSKKLSGIRPFPKKTIKQMFINDKLEGKEFILPQYSALFFNLNKDVFKGDDGKKVRLALQVGTDKQSILESIEGQRIDTPLLESSQNEWRYEYSLERANGSLKDAGYYLPGKKPKTFPPAQSNSLIIEKPSSKAEWIETGNSLVLGGAYPANTKTVVLFRDDKEIDSNTRTLLGPSWKQYPAPEWEFTLSRGQGFIEGRQVIRVKFFDDANKEISTDALSLYGEKAQVIVPEQATSTPIPSEIISTPTIEDSLDPVISPEIIPMDSESISSEEEISINSTSLNENITSEEDVSIPMPADDTPIPTEIPLSLDENTEGNPLDTIRETVQGEKLKLTLLTSAYPSYYGEVAQQVAEQWELFGVSVEVNVLPSQEFTDAVLHREYDVLLFGQNLGYNLDIYEYFHESQVGKYNLSDYKNPQASILIEEIRLSHDPSEREKKLKQLQEILKKDIPAVFLFSPIYTYYSSPNVYGMEIEKIATKKDRLSEVENWYVKTENTFSNDASWKQYPSWISKQLYNFITF